jgi:hypothetical protein
MREKLDIKNVYENVCCAESMVKATDGSLLPCSRKCGHEVLPMASARCPCEEAESMKTSPSSQLHLQPFSPLFTKIETWFINGAAGLESKDYTRMKYDCPAVTRIQLQRRLVHERNRSRRRSMSMFVVPESRESKK